MLAQLVAGQTELAVVPVRATGETAAIARAAGAGVSRQCPQFELCLVTLFVRLVGVSNTALSAARFAAYFLPILARLISRWSMDCFAMYPVLSS
jgi:hypothetical protein